MIKFINKLTGSIMWVADERKDEYLAAGHRLAAICVKPAKKVIVKEPEPKEEAPEEPKAPEPEAPVKEEPKKAAPKKTAKTSKKSSTSKKKK